jgi:hypothetical protein
MWVRLPIVLLVVLTVLLGGLSRERVPVELSALPEASAAPLTSEAEIAAAAPAAAPGPGEVACALHPIAQVVGASAALLAEQIALQHLLDDAAVELSPEEWAAVAGVTSHIQAVRQAYEASIAEVTEAEPGRYSLLVPPYPDAGNLLRNHLENQLRELLGPQAGEQLVRQLGPGLERHFAGFGSSVQTVEFQSDGSGSDDYRVTRTAHYWSASTPGLSPQRRREVYFPAIEDPDGHQWGPFLSRVAEQLQQERTRSES